MPRWTQYRLRSISTTLSLVAFALMTSAQLPATPDEERVAKVLGSGTPSTSTGAGRLASQNATVVASTDEVVVSSPAHQRKRTSLTLASTTLSLGANCDEIYSPVEGPTGAVYGFVRDHIEFDDGSGPMHIVAGHFEFAGGNTVNNVARWDGTSWSPMGNGIPIIHGWDSVRALEVFDDGSGPALYAGGYFSTANGAPADGLVKWDGQSWVAVSNTAGLAVNCLATFDDGTGEALYVGALVPSSLGVQTEGIVRWDGVAWANVGDGFDLAALSLIVWDDGTGDSLYAGGGFRLSGQTDVRRIAKWGGTSWRQLQSGMTHPVRSLAVHDDGTGSALYAGGTFTHAGGVPARKIARWDGSSWSALGPGLQSDVYAMQSFDDGSGPQLFASNHLGATGITSRYLVKWDGANWTPHGDGTVGDIFWLAVVDFGVGLGLHSDGPGGVVHWTCQEIDSGTAHCFGDGSGTNCPCGGTGAAGAGCQNSADLGGAQLIAKGHPYYGKLGFSLHVSNVPSFTSGLVLRGANLVNGGGGLPAGAGLLCVSGQTARSQVQSSGASTGLSFVDWYGLHLAHSSIGTGVETNYQFWYRDIQNPCVGPKFNFSNAWKVTWLP